MKLEKANRQAQAKQYIDEVIDQMSKADSDLKESIKTNIYSLINHCLTYKYLGQSFQFSDNNKLNEEVDTYIRKLRNDIFNNIYLRLQYVSKLASRKEEKENDETILTLFIGLPIAGKTLLDRVDQYVNMLRSEVEAYIAVGISKNLSAHQILNHYIASIKKPYTSPLIINAFNKKGFKAERIVNKGITFGVGQYNSAFNNLVRVHQNTIFQAYNYTLNTIWLTIDNIKGWYTIRGSTYPCQICDNNTGLLHPKDDFFWGYHAKCCCLMIPVYIM